MPEPDPAPKVMRTLASAELLEYEVEQAWQVMRHHERIAEGAKNDLQYCRDRQKREYPKVIAFSRIDNILAGRGLITAEAACEAILKEITNAANEVDRIVESQNEEMAKRKQERQAHEDPLH